ncbi:MAG TPA: glycosyltransferase family 2 protein, partial [Desulfobacterales bacterium]|nr:glycosyltransferase family 2 protein [Desulfobacterales bacterium]
MTQPEFSVIIPVFNGAQFLLEALESVSRQTLQSWECIIIDDGSEDDSVALSEAWAENTGHPVKIMHHPRRE